LCCSNEGVEKVENFGMAGQLLPGRGK